MKTAVSEPLVTNRDAPGKPRVRETTATEPSAQAVLAARFAGIPCPVTREAALNVSRAWRDDPHFEFVCGLTQALAAHIAPGAPSPQGASASNHRLPPEFGRLLIDDFRAEMIRVWQAATPPPDATVILERLQALEELRGAAGSDDAEGFTNLLSGPDGLDLVVEVAHDLRSPLTSILFLAETLQKGQSGEVNDLQHRQLGLIYGAALGLSELASDVIELARGGNGLADDDVSPFSITEILDGIHEIVRPIGEEKRLALRFLPAAQDHRLGHPQALSRVLLNLTTNALKFTEQGFVEIVARAVDVTQVEFSVRDSGPGITAHAARTLYQPFRRAARGEGYDFSGTGLGLAICRKLVEAMGSTLEFETWAKWGTRFFFVLNLPLADQP